MGNTCTSGKNKLSKNSNRLSTQKTGKVLEHYKNP